MYHSDSRLARIDAETGAFTGYYERFLFGSVAEHLAARFGITRMLFIGIAFAEALGIFSFLVALLLMFAV